MPSHRTRLLRGAQDTYRSVESPESARRRREHVEREARLAEIARHISVCATFTSRDYRDIARRAQRFAIDFGAADRIRFDVWSVLLACGGDVTRLHERGGHDIGGEG